MFAYIGLSVLSALMLLVLFYWVCGILVDKNRKYEKDSGFYRGLLYFATEIALWLCRVRVTIVGQESLPDNENFLLVCNHRSNFDPIITWHIMPEYKLAFISKPENFRLPIFGGIIRKCCFMPIDRNDARNAIGTINRAAALLRGGELSVAVYPEGTRSKTGELLPFHNGVLKIAQKAKKPMVIAYVEGTEKVRKNFPFRRTEVTLEILDCISADTVCGMRSAELGNVVRNKLVSRMAVNAGVQSDDKREKEG